jgi:hypothetical protein
VLQPSQSDPARLIQQVALDAERRHREGEVVTIDPFLGPEILTHADSMLSAAQRYSLPELIREMKL